MTITKAEREALRENCEAFNAIGSQQVERLLDALADAERERDEARDALEQERVRLAGCSVAATGYGTPDVVQGVYGWSPAYDDVHRLYDRMNTERTRAEAAEAARATAEAACAVMREALRAIDTHDAEDDEDGIVAALRRGLATNAGAGLLEERDRLRALLRELDAAYDRGDSDIEAVQVRVRAALAGPEHSPKHTDLMVTPGAIDEATKGGG